MTRFYLYSTLGCHLCEEAAALVAPALAPDQVLEVVEIADSEALLARYGTRIPVLQSADSGAEIGWPFDLDAVRALFAASSQP